MAPAVGLSHERRGPLTTRTISKNKEQMRIATLNISTLRDKEEEMIEIMRERKLDILGLCETRLVGSGQKTLHENYKMIYKGREDGHYGVAFIISPALSERVDSVDLRSERIIAITMKLQNMNIGLVQLYAPQTGRPMEEKEQFYNTLQDVIENNKYRQNIIMMGDWNGHVGVNREGYEGVLGAYGIGDRNDDGRRILDFCLINDLSVMNTFYMHRESHKWTWYRWQERRAAYVERSQIDFFVTSNKSLFRDTKALPSVSGDSDHRMVISKVRIGKVKQKQKKRRERIKVENINNEECTRELQQKVIRDLNIEQGDTKHMWKIFKDKFTAIIKETVGMKIMKGTKKKQTPWWTEEVREAVKAKMKAYRRWMKSRNIIDRHIYVEKRNEAEQIKRRSKEEVYIKIGHDLENDVRGTRKLLYSLAKNYRKGNTDRSIVINDKDGNLLTEEDQIADRWREYFQELLNVETGAEDLLEEVDCSGGEHVNITIGEVKRALEEMKAGKAAGEDGIVAEIYKAGGPRVLEILQMILNSAYREEVVPDDWQQGVTCPIYKNKGSRQECGQHRGITLLAHIEKIYERILERRIRAQVEDNLGEWQHGFRPGRSTTDLIFALKIHMEKVREWGNSREVVFIDMEKAFDCINRNNLWRALLDEHYGINPKLIRAVKSLYKNCKNKVKGDNIDSSWFSIETGVRQGGVISPLLFIIYMDKCMREICRDETEETLAYADDVAVIASSPEGLQNAVDRWTLGLERNGMKMNVEKSETMHIGKNRRELQIMAGGRNLMQVENFKYLGVTFNEDCLQEVEINQRIAKYTGNVSMLYPLLKDRNIPRTCKVTMFNTILKPILLYGAECWSLTAKLKSKIQAAEMKVLRLIKGVTRRDRLRNTYIREELGCTAVLEDIERSKLRWYGHVSRMNDNRIAKKQLVWAPTGKRPVGRPRKRWLDGVSEAITRRGKTLREVEDTRLFEDRGGWRTFTWEMPS